MGVIATVLKVAAPVAALGYMLAGSNATGVEKRKAGPKRRQAKASRKTSRKTRRAKKRRLLKEVREETRH